MISCEGIKDNTVNPKAATKHKKTELVGNRGALVESWKPPVQKGKGGRGQSKQKTDGKGNVQAGHSDGHTKSEWSVGFHSVSGHRSCFLSSYALVPVLVLTRS